MANIYPHNECALDNPRLYELFLDTLAETGQVTKACKACDISAQTAYRYRQRDTKFAARWEEAIGIGGEVIESEVIRRSVFGHDEPIVYQGQFVPIIDYDAIDPETGVEYPPALAPVKRDSEGRVVYATVKKYSDSLAGMVLRAHSPRYKDQSKLEITGANGGPLDINTTHQLNETEAAARITALLALARKRKDQEPEPDISDLV